MSRSSTTARTASRIADVAASVGAGVFAAALGYLVTYLALPADTRDDLAEITSEWIGTAWVYYNAHAVEIHRSGEAFGVEGSDTVNFIAQSNEASAQLLYLVPPLVLVLVGVLAAIQWDARRAGEGVLAALPVVVGYALAMGVGTVVAEERNEMAVFGVEVGGAMAPELQPAILLGGVLYPLLFATAGAVLTAAANA